MEKKPYRERKLINRLAETYGQDLSANELLPHLIADAWSLGNQDTDYDEVWRYKPVDSRTFYEKFLNEPLWPIQQEFNDRVFGYDPLKFRDTTFMEGYAYWGKGSGKDATIAKMFTYGIYLLCCLRDPQGFLGYGRNSPIDIGNVSINARQARDVFFKNLKNCVRNAVDPATGDNWFATRNHWKESDGTTRQMDLREGHDIQSITINFGRGITAHSLNSETYTGEGLTLLFVAFDEIGAFPMVTALGGGGKRGLHDALKDTVISRNPRRFGIILTFSYKYDEDCPMSVLVRRAKDNENAFVSGPHATFDVNPNVVRQDFAESYLKDPDVAKRTFECLDAGRGILRAIRRQEVIELNINTERTSPVVGRRDLGLYSTDDAMSLHFASTFRGIPGMPYFVHVDQSLGRVEDRGDAAGLALGHPEASHTNVPSVLVNELAEMGIDAVAEQGKEKQGVFVDLMLQVVARPDSEIILAELRKFIWRLKIEMGFNIVKVTFDGWQSVEGIQEFKAFGMQADTYSVDRKPEAYDTLKELEYQGLINRYKNPIYERELAELIRKPDGKYDHPPFSAKRVLIEGIDRGSKDVSDAVAAIAVHCMKSSAGHDTFGLAFAGIGSDSKPLSDEEAKEKLRKWEEHADEVEERKRREFESGDFDPTDF